MTAGIFEKAVDVKRKIAQAEQVEKAFTAFDKGFIGDRALTDLGEAIIPFKGEILNLISTLKANAELEFEKL